MPIRYAVCERNLGWDSLYAVHRCFIDVYEASKASFKFRPEVGCAAMVQEQTPNHCLKCKLFDKCPYQEA